MRFTFPSFSPILLLVCLCTCAGIVATNAADSPSGPATTDFQVHFIDVGTADCIWIHTGDDGIPNNGKLEGFNILIDGGNAPTKKRNPSGYSTAIEYLIEDDRLPVGSTIDWLIVTHPHTDHFGGLSNVLDNYDVLSIIDPGHDIVGGEEDLPATERPNSKYFGFLQKAGAEYVNGAKSEFVWGIPDDFEMDWGEELLVEVLYSSTELVHNDPNNCSIVLSVAFANQSPAHKNSFLFTGDAEEAVEEKLVAQFGDDLQADVLKIGHHCSNSSSYAPFLKAVKPEHAVISVGNKKFRGTILPSQDALDRIASAAPNTTVWRTDRDDKVPDLVPYGEEAGDDTVVAWVSNGVLTIMYADETSTAVSLDDSRCQAMTKSGPQCKRNKKSGFDFCWQHK